MAASGSSQLSAGVEGLRHVGRFSVGAPGDRTEDCDIAGIAECGVGFVVLDGKNKSVKLFDRDFTYLHHVKLEGPPLDICCEQDVVFVCVFNPAIVWKIKVNDKRLVEVAQWRGDSRWKYCRGVCVCQQGLAVCVYRVPGTAILLLDKETGETRREIGLEGDSGKLCAVDGGSTIAVAAGWRVLFVDLDTGKSTGVKCGGRWLYGITAGPRGDSAIVADVDGGLFVVSARGAHVIKEGEEGREAGRGVCYLPQTHRLVWQTDRRTDRVEIYQLLLEPVIPVEIRRLDDSSIRFYKEALAEGSVKDHDIRVMIVGHAGSGKTTLTKRLLRQPVNITERIPTEGIEVHAQRCRVKLNNDEWEVLKPDEQSMNTSRKLVQVLKERNNLDTSPEQKESRDQNKHTSTEDTTRTAKIRAASDEKTSRKRYTIIYSRLGNTLEEGTIPDELESQPTVKTEEEIRREKRDKQIKTEIKKLMDDVKTTVPADEAYISIWDFAGQSLFYTTHHVFLSTRPVFLLLTDLSKKLDDTIEDDNCFLDSRGQQKCTVSDFLQFWIKSIMQHCQETGQVVPRIVLVGTKTDLLPQEKKDEIVNEHFKGMYKVQAVKECVQHIVNRGFSVDNTTENDPNLPRLMEAIVEAAKNQSFWGNDLPAKWINLENALLDLCLNCMKIMKTSDVVILGESMPVPVAKDEIDVFLRYLHERGAVIYFNEPGMNDHVLLDPQWLVDALKFIITFPETRRNRLRNPDMLGKLEQFEKTAVIEKTLIDAIWNDEENGAFRDYKDYLVSLLVRLHLMAKLSNDNDDGAALLTTQNHQYLVPCVLKEAPPPHLIPTVQSTASFASTSRLCLLIPDNCFPSAVFNKLLAACASEWDVVHQKDQALIFCGCGVFEINSSHWVTVHLWEQVIQLWVTKFSRTGNRPGRSVCKTVRAFVQTTLRSALHAHNDLDEYIKCPDAPLDSRDGLFNANRLDDDDEEVACKAHDAPHCLCTFDLRSGWFVDPGSKQDKRFDFEILQDGIIGNQTTSRVAKGMYFGQPQAIKMLKYTDPENESEMKDEMLIVNHLRTVHHDNILTFHFAKLDSPYLYLVLELCDGNLDDYVIKPATDPWKVALSPTRVNMCMADGLKFLHDNNIIHKNLKPPNVLFRFAGGNIPKVCLADFAMAKRNSDGAYSVHGTFGTEGYIAPEVFDNVNKVVLDGSCDRKSDIFSLSVLFCYSCTGKHPFGEPQEQQANMSTGDASLAATYNYDHACGNLTEEMLNPNPAYRPDIAYVCQHPSLWSDEYVMDFLNKLSDALEGDKANRGWPPWPQLDVPGVIPNNNWITNLPPNLQAELAKYKQPGKKMLMYQGTHTSVYFLLRAIRNTNHHSDAYSAGAKSELGTYPSGHWKVWKDSCPRLLLHLYNSLSELRLAWVKDKLQKGRKQRETIHKPRRELDIYEV